MTHRERLENKSERLQEWANNRVVKAQAVFNRNEPFTRDWAFITQPGHIPERARIIAQEDKAHESLEKAAGMKSRAAGIQNQLDRSVFSDDSNAIEALQARIAKNEAIRDRMKAINSVVRSNPKNKLTEEKVVKIVALGLCESLARDAFTPDFCGRIGYPDYALTNIGATIRKDKQRIEEVKLRQARASQAEASENGVTIEQCSGGYVRVTFAEKPSREILEALRSNGFRWGQGSWAGKAESLPEAVRP